MNSLLHRIFPGVYGTHFHVVRNEIYLGQLYSKYTWGDKIKQTAFHMTQKSPRSTSKLSIIEASNDLSLRGDNGSGDTGRKAVDCGASTGVPFTLGVTDLSSATSDHTMHERQGVTHLDVSLNIRGLVLSRALGSTGVAIPEPPALASFRSRRFRSASSSSALRTASTLARRFRSFTLASLSERDSLSSSRGVCTTGSLLSLASMSATSA